MNNNQPTTLAPLTADEWAALYEPMTLGPVEQVLYESTLAMVRELVEKATVRPAPRKLFCVPVRRLVLKPIPKWKSAEIRLRELAASVDLNSPFVIRHSSP